MIIGDPTIAPPYKVTIVEIHCPMPLSGGNVFATLAINCGGFNLSKKHHKPAKQFRVDYSIIMRYSSAHSRPYQVSPNLIKDLAV